MSNQEKQPTETSVRARLRADLLAARKARQRETASTLGTLLAAIDHAEAVDVDTSVVPLIGRTNDVPRKHLTEDDMQAILRAEAADLKAALAQYEQVGQADKVAEIQAALAVVGRYLEA